MTLPELAALAEKVEGFDRPVRDHQACDGTGAEWRGARSFPCSCQFSAWEQGSGTEWDNSPAAFLMAVALASGQLFLGNVLVHVTQGDRPVAEATIPGERNAEALARAALVALLRAHGVDVSE